MSVLLADMLGYFALGGCGLLFFSSPCNSRNADDPWTGGHWAISTPCSHPMTQLHCWAKHLLMALWAVWLPASPFCFVNFSPSVFVKVLNTMLLLHTDIVCHHPVKFDRSTNFSQRKQYKWEKQVWFWKASIWKVYVICRLQFPQGVSGIQNTSFWLERVCAFSLSSRAQEVIYKCQLACRISDCLRDCRATQQTC